MTLEAGNLNLGKSTATEPRNLNLGRFGGYDKLPILGSDAMWVSDSQPSLSALRIGISFPDGNGVQGGEAMDSQSTQPGSSDASDEAAIRDIPAQMIDAWNNGSGTDFAAAFSATADFVAFEGCTSSRSRSDRGVPPGDFRYCREGTQREGE